MAAPIQKCSIGVYSPISCDFSSLHPSDTNLIRLRNFQRDISSHLIRHGVRSGVKGRADIANEGDLICKRVGIFSVENDFTVCPHHRDVLGVYWRPKTTCQFPSHKGGAKPYRSFNSMMSKRVVSELGTLVPIGSGTTNDEKEDEDWTSKLRTRKKGVSIIDVCQDSWEVNDSQTSTEYTDSQGSNWSLGEEAQVLKEVQLSDVNMAINILGQGHISPLRSKLHTYLMEAKDRTVRYYKRKAAETSEALFEAIAPKQGHMLKKISTQNPDTSKNDDLFSVVGVMYRNVKDINIKCQLLSLVVNRFSKTELLNHFPEITKHQIDKARRHAFSNGPGADIPPTATRQHRERINYSKLQHAIEFFSDPSFNQISSYTTRDLKLDSGDVLVIPEVVRTVIHLNLIKLYYSYCKTSEIKPLSESTLYEVLKACGASKRKCLKGLDNIAVDGSSAYDSLITLVDKLDKSQEWKTDVKNKLLTSRLYLKTDYKLHIKREDKCAFHCIQYALSDPKTPLMDVDCDHQHNGACRQCYLFGEVVTEIRSVIHKLPPEEQEMLLQELNISISQVDDWRSHILRTINQDQARLDVLGEMKSHEVLLIMDWAMKYLPQVYREKMKDFFGQKGVHWHVCVAVFKDDSGTLVHKTYTHIMDHVKQDFFAVLSILEHTLTTLKQQLPHITETYLRSDNAGCYHCGQLWLSIPSLSVRTGIRVKQYDYSEAQSGKSYCDAKIAYMRSKMRTYSVEGHDICTATQMKEAIDDRTGIKGTYAAVVDVDLSKQEIKTHSWKGVSFISNIEYTSSGVKTWKAYKIGNGVFKDSESLERLGQKQPATCLSVIKNFHEHDEQNSVGQIHLKSTEESVKEINCDSTTTTLSLDSTDTRTNEILFYCPEYNCMKSYQTFDKLNEHLLIGKHVEKHTSESSSDQAKKLWAEKCDSLLAPCHSSIENEMQMSSSLDMPLKGCALKKDKKYTRFSVNVKSYLTDLFKKGEETGKKENPTSVARDMRNVMEDGKKKFLPSEWLQPSQIASFFFRLSSNLGKTNVICVENVNDSNLVAIMDELQNQEVFENLSRLN